MREIILAVFFIAGSAGIGWAVGTLAMPPIDNEPVWHSPFFNMDGEPVWYPTPVPRDE